MATTTKKNKNFLFLGGKDKVTPLPSTTSGSTTLQFEFDEADIWSNNNSEETSNKPSIPSSRFSRKNTRKGGEKRVVNNATSSLPVNVPDWRKILGGDHDDDKGSFGRNLVYDFDDVDDDGDYESNKDDEYYRIPPHEYLARTRVASFSVHEVTPRNCGMKRLGRKKENMGRKQIFLGLGLIMVMGLAVYLRLWTIDYNLSTSETELLRRQFDLASREAMDESAVWRKRYDDEETKSSACQKELIKVKQLLKENGAASIKKKLDLLQKENIDLLERLEALKQELESEKLKCSMRHI